MASTLTTIPEVTGAIPTLCGFEQAVQEAAGTSAPAYLGESDVDFAHANSTFAIALHMHQPLIPAGGGDLRTAEIIGNLQQMFENPGVGDNHNASVFHWCYKRMSEFIPALVAQGKHPRVMLDYSGTLLWGLRKQGLDDVIESLRTITCDRRYRRCVEWLGMAWGHPVAPSTPVQDFRLHVRAWQHHFAGLFGLEALSRVRGFSPSEMALPNNPDVAYEFVRTLRECGYRWVLVQEHTVERVEDGGPLHNRHLPHRLVARNSRGQVAEIIAVIKTQGSDTKLIGQMQPYYEAAGLSRTTLGGKTVPPLVVQISDGENGGVMMNEFPGKFIEASSLASGSATPPVNVTEYLEHLEAMGVTAEHFPAVQPTLQKRIWDRFENGQGPEAMESLIRDLAAQDGRFHMEGGSWTSNISWVRGYDRVMGPMEEASALFAARVLDRHIPTSDPRYGNALYHLLLTQTSCFRYWGEGAWTDYARELVRRTTDILQHDFPG